MNSWNSCEQGGITIRNNLKRSVMHIDSYLRINAVYLETRYVDDIIELYETVIKSLEEYKEFKNRKYFWYPKIFENTNYLEGNGKYFNLKIHYNTFYIGSKPSTDEYQTKFTEQEFMEICNQIELNFDDFEKEEV